MEGAVNEGEHRLVNAIAHRVVINRQRFCEEHAWDLGRERNEERLDRVDLRLWHDPRPFTFYLLGNRFPWLAIVS